MAFRRLHYFQESLKFQLESLNDYVRESTQNLKQKQTDLDKDLKDALAGLDDSDVTQHIVDNFLDENLKYYKDFPSYLNESSFLIIYSFFETNLARICKYTRLDLNITRSSPINALPKSSYIIDSKDYLVQTCGLSLKREEASWRKLDKLRDFRNFIAHNNLDLKQTKNAADKASKKKTINYINRVFGKSISTDNLHKSKIDRDELITEMLLLIEKYLQFVVDIAIKKVR